MNSRLQQFLAAENITQAQFADSIRVARAGVSHIIAGRNKPGYDFIINTMRRYPDLNIEWLLTGKGKMYRNSPDYEQSVSLTPAISSKTETEEINLFNLNDGQEQEEEISTQEARETLKNKLTDTLNALDSNTEQAVKQRKATKIIVFYDDNTFQEF